MISRIVGGRVVNHGEVVGSTLVLDGPRIAGVDSSAGQDATHKTLLAVATRSSGGQAAGSAAYDLDAEGCWVVPGFVDLHCHGAVGVDFATASAEEMGRALAYHLGHGTTTCLPTIASTSLPGYLAQIKSQPPGEPGALGSSFGGYHLEGPFLNPEQRGASSLGSLLLPGEEVVAQLLDAAGGRVRMVTLAPELPGIGDIALGLRAAGVVVAAGHTGASRDEALAAARDGLFTHVTHLFNGMPPFHHRQPGVFGALFACRDLTCDLICDGKHLDPAVVHLVTGSLGFSRVALITDAVSACGAGPGEFPLGDSSVTVRVAGEAPEIQGRLAGSVLTMDRAVANAVGMCGVSVGAASLMASEVPARVAGFDDRGSFDPGMAADCVLLDQRLSLVAVVRAGQLVEPSLGQDTPHET